MRGTAVGLTLVFSLLEACRAAPDRAGSAGHFDVEWTGSGGGKLSVPATAQWCPNRRLLEIRAVQGDTGIALAIYPAETVATGGYRVVDPLKADSVRPAARVALRWLTQNAVQGFQGDSGTVDLERSDSGQLSGQVRARARSVVDLQRVAVTGSFQKLAIRPGPTGCTETSEHPEPRDTGVH